MKSLPDLWIIQVRTAQVKTEWGGSMKTVFKRLINIKMDKGWMWLLYLDILLPSVLFFLALAAGRLGKGGPFSALFHSYNLYIINPIPNFNSFTGIPGLGIHIGAVAYALKRKDRKDMVLCLAFLILAFIYNYFEINYMLSYMLDF